jgi:hypothetical protein
VESDAFQQVRAIDPSSKQAAWAFPYQPESSSELHPDAAALLQGVQKVLTLSACSLSVDKSRAAPLLVSRPQAASYAPVPFGKGVYIDGWQPRRQVAYPLVAVSKIGKVVAAGSWKIFTDAFIQDPRYQNQALWRNILDWCVGSE